jgi:N-acetylneuraminic acid mutarotase
MDSQLRALTVGVAVAVCWGSAAFARELTFEDRVKAQETIERVYYSHQIGATNPFEEAVPRAVLERRVARLLELSSRVERRNGIRITPAVLRRELERIAVDTKLPDRLLELYEALGSDPVVIAECLARASLVDRLAADMGALDERGPRRDVGGVTFIDDRAYGTGVPLPAASANACIGDNSWSGGVLDDPPGARTGNTAVWTGTEMIVWGGTGEVLALRGDGLRYDPALDTWRPISSAGAPSARRAHTAVWTGSRMVVWGGETTVSSRDWTNTGGRYDPVADVWSPTSTAGAPEGRTSHIMVWTGSRVVVWGGDTVTNNEVQTGGRYDPVADTWQGTSTLLAPAGRSVPTSVWTGSRVVVWGGFVSGVGGLDTGGRYDPVADTWSPVTTTGAPAGRWLHTAVWSGSRMIVWGGTSPSGGATNTGGRYDPAADAWAPTSTVDAPTARGGHAAVWTGARMVVWGGGGTTIGGRYDPATDSWAPMTTSAAPSARNYPSMVWTGSRVIVWGGGTDTGGRYDPVADNWTPTATNPGPVARQERSTVWTGTEMIVWGGAGPEGFTNSGAAYDPALDAWRNLSSAGAPTARSAATAVWTGTEMIVWGGAQDPGSAFDTGGRYNPLTDSWSATSVAGAPLARSDHTAVWTGTEMIVWGGQVNFFTNCVGRFLSTGARYDPAADSWSAITNANAPEGRGGHTAVWTGTQMVVWGGSDEQPNLPGSCLPLKLGSGARYDPAGDTWTPTASNGAPSARTGHTAVWTGSEMVIWGAVGSDGTPSGGRYRPDQDAWSATTLVGAPGVRTGHSAVWTNSKMIVWGGHLELAGTDTNTGGRYDPVLDAWTPTALANAPAARTRPSAVWADGTMIVWDGSGYHSGSRYGSGNPDADGDGIADACDVCPLDPLNDGDNDGICGSVDNCPSESNHAQLDSDADGLGELCDNCPLVANVNQADSDDDAAGDACDCQPSDPTDRKPVEATPLSVGKTGTTANLSWPPVGDTDSYSVSRGDLASKGTSQYGTCQADGLPSPSYDDTAVPSPGQGFFYLVQAQNYDCGLGSLGTTSSEQQRTNSNPSACGGVSVADAHASSQSTTLGTVTGTLANTQSSNDQYETITEVLSSGGNPANRFSELEQRFTITVGSGTKKELHVEGFRSSSTDGDDFRFEYSTDGVNFTPVTLTFPLADDNVDRIATLPGSLTGAVTLRAVDTDRTAGHQTLDTVTIDELWIRAVP